MPGDERLLKVNFVIRPKPDAEPSLHHIETSLFKCKAGNIPLVPDQIGPISYDVIDLEPADERLLQTLAAEHERREDLEKQIETKAAETKSQAEALMQYAHRVHAQTKDNLAEEKKRYDDINREFESATEEFRDYEMVRSRCIQLKLMKELLNDNHNALYNRIRTITERLTVLKKTIGQTDKSLQTAIREKESQFQETQFSLDKLLQLRDEAVRSSEEEIQQVTKKDLEIKALHQKWDAETRRQVKSLQQESLRDKTATVSKNEKQKLRLLSYSKELTTKERAAKITMLQKKILVRNFNQLKDALSKQAQRDGELFEQERQEVEMLQKNLNSKRDIYPGQNVEARLKALEKSEQDRLKAEYESAIANVKKTRDKQTEECKAQSKALFQKISKQIGDDMSAEMAKHIEAKTRAREREVEEKKQMEVLLQERNSKLNLYMNLKQSKEVEINRERAKRAQDRRANKAKLKSLRQNVRQLWRRYDISSRVCLSFMKNLFKEISNNAASPETVERCKQELKRLLALKRIGQNIESRSILAAKVQRKKKEGLMPRTSKAALDAIATDLWQNTEMLHGKNREIVAQIEGYEKQYHPKKFRYRGKPYLEELTAEMNQRDETVKELIDNMPHFDANIHSEHKFQTARSRKDLDSKYLAAHQKLKSRVMRDEEEHTAAGDHGFDRPDLNILHNTLERIGYHDE